MVYVMYKHTKNKIEIRKRENKPKQQKLKYINTIIKHMNIQSNDTKNKRDHVM